MAYTLVGEAVLSECVPGNCRLARVMEPIIDPDDIMENTSSQFEEHEAPEVDVKALCRTRAGSISATCLN